MPRRRHVAVDDNTAPRLTVPRVVVTPKPQTADNLDDVVGFDQRGFVQPTPGELQRAQALHRVLAIERHELDFEVQGRTVGQALLGLVRNRAAEPKPPQVTQPILERADRCRLELGIGRACHQPAAVTHPPLAERRHAHRTRQDLKAACGRLARAHRPENSAHLLVALVKAQHCRRRRVDPLVICRRRCRVDLIKLRVLGPSRSLALGGTPTASWLRRLLRYGFGRGRSRRLWLAVFFHTERDVRAWPTRGTHQRFDRRLCLLQNPRLVEDGRGLPCRRQVLAQPLRMHAADLQALDHFLDDRVPARLNLHRTLRHPARSPANAVSPAAGACPVPAPPGPASDSRAGPAPAPAPAYWMPA